MRILLVSFFFWLGIGLVFIPKHPMPAGVHAWAQADRLSLSLRFLEDRALLEPATHCLQTDDGRVGCEFPLLQWAVAKTARFLGWDASLWLLYKWVVWSFWGLLGLTLFRLQTRIFSLPPLVASLFSLLLLSSPLVLFYGHTFLLDIPALSLTMLSLFFFLDYCRDPKPKAYYFALGLAAMAALFKVSAFIYFAALVGTFFFQTLRATMRDGFRFRLFIPFLLVSVFSFLFFYYNKFHYVQFNKDHWSFVFLSETRPLASWEDWKGIFYAFNKWKYELLSIPQWLLLIGVSVGAGFVSLNKHTFLVFLAKPSPQRLFSLLFTAGLIGLLYLLGKQLLDHDYYFLVLFFPALWLVFMRSFAIVYKHYPLFRSKLSLFFFACFVVFIFHNSVSQQQSRFAPFYQKGEVQIHTPLEWLANGKEVLDSLGVAPNASILVPYAFSMNIHLVHLNRKGLIVTSEEMARDTLFMENWRDRIQADYFVMETHLLDAFYERNPNYVASTSLLYSNEKMSVLALNK